MDDEIADLEIAQVREECRRQRAFAAASSCVAALPRRCRSRRRRCSAASGRRKPRDRQSFGDEHRAFDALVGAGREQRAKLVVVQQFHGALGAAVRAGDEENGVAAVARLAHVRNPVRDAAAEFLRGLRRRRAAPRWSAPASSIAELLERRAAVEKRRDVRPSDSISSVGRDARGPRAVALAATDERRPAPTISRRSRARLAAPTRQHASAAMREDSRTAVVNALRRLRACPAPTRAPTRAPGTIWN